MSPPSSASPPGRPGAFTFSNDTDDAHAFTVEELGIDMEVPSGRTRTVVIEAPPGRYHTDCSVGSHQADGMKGQFVITGPDSSDADRASSTDRHSHHG